MSRSIFGWDLPPGCTHRMIDEAAGVEQPCAVCCKLVDDCICPACDACGEQGNPACYTTGHENYRGHLALTREQVIARTEARMTRISDMLAEEAQALDYLKDGGEFSTDLKDSPDPWR